MYASSLPAHNSTSCFFSTKFSFVLGYLLRAQRLHHSDHRRLLVAVRADDQGACARGMRAQSNSHSALWLEWFYCLRLFGGLQFSPQIVALVCSFCLSTLNTLAINCPLQWPVAVFVASFSLTRLLFLVACFLLDWTCYACRRDMWCPGWSIRGWETSRATSVARARSRGFVFVACLAGLCAPMLLLPHYACARTTVFFTLCLVLAHAESFHVTVWCLLLCSVLLGTG